MEFSYISDAARHDHGQCVPRWLLASALTCAETLLSRVRLYGQGIPFAELAQLTGVFEYHQVSAMGACRPGLLTSSAGGRLGPAHCESGKSPQLSFQKKESEQVAICHLPGRNPRRRGLPRGGLRAAHASYSLPLGDISREPAAGSATMAWLGERT